MLLSVSWTVTPCTGTAPSSAGRSSSLRRDVATQARSRNRMSCSCTIAHGKDTPSQQPVPYASVGDSLLLRHCRSSRPCLLLRQPEQRHPERRCRVAPGTQRGRCSRGGLRGRCDGERRVGRASGVTSISRPWLAMLLRPRASRPALASVCSSHLAHLPLDKLLLSTEKTIEWGGGARCSGLFFRSDGVDVLVTGGGSTIVVVLFYDGHGRSGSSSSTSALMPCVVKHCSPSGSVCVVDARSSCLL